jgi:hypothetical protein
MATQTLTDVTRNYDDAAISGLVNGDTMVLNNSNLIINSDSRWGQQAAVMGRIAITTNLGGTVTIDGRDVWWIPFDAATGVVPTLGVLDVINVTGSIAGLGEFLGIFSATGIVPLAAGVNIPQNGFIKLRKKTENFIDNEVITLSNGATLTINSTAGGRRGWIHVVGAGALSIEVPRLGKLTTIGDYFELGTTNGSDDQTFQFPIADNCPGIQVETAVGSGVYEWWNNAGDRWGTATQYVATDERGKYFGMVNTTGVITIARRATNTCGFKPVSGLRVRIPNIINSSSNATDWNVNVIYTTLSSRYDLITTSGGEIDMQHLCGSWYISCTSAYSVSLKNSALLAIAISNTAAKSYIDNLSIGIDAVGDYAAIIISSLFSGLDFRNVRASKYSSVGSNNSVVSLTDIIDLTIENVSIESFGSATTTGRGTGSARSISSTRCDKVIINNITTVCGILSFQTCTNLTVNNFKFAERLNGTTDALTPVFAIEFANSSSNIFMEGYSQAFPSITNLHPYSGLVVISNSSHIELRNIGTPTSKINGGSVALTQMGVFVSSIVSTGLIFRRCYLENLRTNVFILPNTVQNVIIENVWGDVGDVQAIQALDITPKGCEWTPSVIAQLSVYGRHCEDTFISKTNGRITFIANEPLVTTADQCVITSGTPKFNSAGSIQMPNIGDQVEWQMPYFALGHTKLGGFSTMNTIGVLMSNLDFDYAINTGSGFSTWKPLIVVRFRVSGGGIGTNTIVITPVTGSRVPQIGDYVGVYSGVVPNGTTVTNIVGDTITISNNFTANAGSGIAVFFWNVIETEPIIDPTIGVKLKVRSTTMVANTSNSVSYIQVATTTDSISQQIQYPLPVVQNDGVISGIEIGSRIQVFNVTTNLEIVNEIVTTPDWLYGYSEGVEFTSGDNVRVRVTKIGFLPFTGSTLASNSGWNILVLQEVDDIYNLYGIDGSGVTKFTADYINFHVDLTTATNFLGSEFYSWFCWELTKTDGIRNFFGVLESIDIGNLRINTDVGDIYFDNTTSTNVFQSDNIRIFRSDDNYPVINPTTGGGGIDLNWRSQVYTVNVGGSSLTPLESAALFAIEPDLTVINNGIKKASLLIPHTTNL